MIPVAAAVAAAVFALFPGSAGVAGAHSSAVGADATDVTVQVLDSRTDATLCSGVKPLGHTHIVIEASCVNGVSQSDLELSAPAGVFPVAQEVFLGDGTVELTSNSDLC